MIQIKSKDRKVRSYFRQFFSLITLTFTAVTAHSEISAPISGQLDNGLNYTLLPLYDEKGHLEVRLKVAAGAVDELEHQGGVAHMLEHSVFHATEKFQGEKYPLGMMSYLLKIFGCAAQLYARTTFDSTTL